jgi:hypothetical protein
MYSEMVTAVDKYQSFSVGPKPEQANVQQYTPDYVKQLYHVT